MSGLWRKKILVRFLFVVLISLAVLNFFCVNYGLQLGDTIDHHILSLSQKEAQLEKDLPFFDPERNVFAVSNLAIQRNHSFEGLNISNDLRRLLEGIHYPRIDQRSYKVKSKLKRVEKSHKLSYKSEPQVTVFAQQSSGESACNKLSITRTNRYSYGTCQPHKPTEASCLLAQTLYDYDPSLTQCKTNARYIKICSFNSEIVKSKVVVKAKCERSVCDRLLKEITPEGKSVSSLFYGVYTLDPEDGFLKSLRNFSTISELEARLPRVAERSGKIKLSFVFVKCFTVSNVTLASQLLAVPPRVTVQVASIPRSKNTINVNIVLLDSVSRAHFYRSLPKTVETFKKLSNNPTESPAKVFDFELFQAVHGHTTQNEHALFTGELLPPLDTEEDTPAVGGEVLFGHFKRAGYQTMWQEDLCWMGGWGLLMDLAAEDWYDMQSKLQETFLDSTGSYVNLPV